jgi:predicted acylesterase/phospholipase RssA
MSSQELRNLQEAYMEVVENQQLDEAKYEKNMSPDEKEDVRNQRAFGSTSLKNRATGMRRTFAAAGRGVKKEIPTGNEKSEISGRFNITRAELRRQIRKLEGRKSGRNFSKRVRQELKAKKYIKQRNSDFAAKNAENKISKFRREDFDIYDIILSHLIDEGYAETPEAAEAIMVNMSEEWRDSIIDCD